MKLFDFSESLYIKYASVFFCQFILITFVFVQKEIELSLENFDLQIKKNTQEYF